MGKSYLVFPLQNMTQNDWRKKKKARVRQWREYPAIFQYPLYIFLPILAVWDHRILDNLIAPHANKVEAAFLFDAVQNMQLSQGQVAAKHFHVPQPFLPQEKLPQTSQFQFYTKVWDLQGLEPLRFRMLTVVSPVWGRVPGPLITIILLPILVWMKTQTFPWCPTSITIQTPF